MAAYERAIAGADQPAIGGKHIKPGTIDDLVARYFASAAFVGLPSEATRATYRGIVEGIRKEHGSKRVAHLQPEHVEHLFLKKKETPAAANNWLRMMRMLMKFAISKSGGKMIASDPTAGIKTLHYATQGFHTWSEDEIAKFNEQHPIGSKARLAMTLMLYTGCRRADVVQLGPANIKNGALTYTQDKNRIRKPVTLTIPVHPELQRVIAATPMVGVKTFLVTNFGKPFTKAGFGNWMRDRCDEAELPDCSAHGLRKAIATRLAEAGMSEHQIMAITGHVTTKEVQRYTHAARQKVMAEMAMRGLESERDNCPDQIAIEDKR
jgi:site-specific recombinase XerD